jgi:hypothetical protein
VAFAAASGASLAGSASSAAWILADPLQGLQRACPAPDQALPHDGTSCLPSCCSMPAGPPLTPPPPPLLSPPLPTCRLQRATWPIADTTSSPPLPAGRLQRAVVAVYEQVKPDDAFGRQMVANLAARGCPLKGIAGTPSLVEHCRRLERCGWRHARAWDMDSVYRWAVVELCCAAAGGLPY